MLFFWYIHRRCSFIYSCKCVYIGDMFHYGQLVPDKRKAERRGNRWRRHEGQWSDRYEVSDADWPVGDQKDSKRGHCPPPTTVCPLPQGSMEPSCRDKEMHSPWIKLDWRKVRAIFGNEVQWIIKGCNFSAELWDAPCGKSERPGSTGNSPQQHNTFTLCWFNYGFRLRRWPILKPAQDHYAVFFYLVTKVRITKVSPPLEFLTQHIGQTYQKRWITAFCFVTPACILWISYFV